MTLFYSKSENGFYSRAVHGDKMPDDAMEISQGEHLALLLGQIVGKQITGDDDGRPYLIDPLPQCVEQLCSKVDAIANMVRGNIVGDVLHALECQRATTEARAFADAGYPADSVPRSVSAWAINGRSVREAADSILNEAAKFTEVLYQIREIRLEAKEGIRIAFALGEADRVEGIIGKAAAAFNAMRGGVG